MFEKKMIAEHNPLANADPKYPYLVSLEKFAHFINWFGPIDIRSSIIDKMCSVMEKPWFFGDFTKEQAEESLAAEQPGTFLVRASTTQQDQPFTISKVSAKRKINHQRINKDKKGALWLTITNDDTKDSKKSRRTKRCP